MLARRIARRTLLGVLLASSAVLCAQTTGRYEVSAAAVGEHSNRANSSQSVSMTGGEAGIAVDLHRGWGLAANFSGTHSGSVGQSGVPLTLTTLTFGPHYRYGKKRLSTYGALLFGFAHGSDSVFPGSTTVTTTASSYAIELEGGMDLGLRKHLAWRMIEVGWVHTALPNGVNNEQDNFRAATGIVFRFGK